LTFVNTEGVLSLERPSLVDLLVFCACSLCLYVSSMQWRNYERRSEAIASGRQAAGGALGRRVVCFTAEFLKTEGR